MDIVPIGGFPSEHIDGSAVKLERILLAELEDMAEEVGVTEMPAGEVEIARDHCARTVLVGHGELPHADSRPWPEDGAGVHDRSGSQSTPVADPGAVEHHRLRRDVDGIAEDRKSVV